MKVGDRPLSTSAILARKAELANIGGWALALNTIWEFGHAGPLYDMWSEVSVASGLFHITLAILGDVLIVFGITFVACCLVGVRHVLPPASRGVAALVSLGLIAAVVLEWLPRSLDWWTYNDYMPTIRVFGHSLGLSPVMQITLLPAISVYLAFRVPIYRRGSGEHGETNS